MEIRNKLGQLIPDDHFENEPGPPGGPSSLSPENEAALNRATDRAIVEALRIKRARIPTR